MGPLRFYQQNLLHVGNTKIFTGKMILFVVRANGWEKWIVHLYSAGKLVCILLWCSSKVSMH